MNFCFDHWELEDRSLEESYARSNSSSSKKVKYAKTCAVILIPSRDEYFKAGINLWYDRKDLKLSQYQASIELKHIMEENPVLTMEAAMTYLYQPTIEILYRDIDCWFSTRNLNLLVIDRNTKNANDTINDVINSQPKWQWSACVAHSGDVAIKMIKNGSQPFDIVLIDESIGVKETFSFGALVNIFRSIFGDSVFIGCTVTDQFDGIGAINCTANASKKEALKAGCDFVWKRPVSNFAKMLPILLATRNKVPHDGAVTIGTASPKPPPRNRSSERSLASLDGLPETDSNENSDDNEGDCEDTFVNRVKNLMKFHDEFELKEGMTVPSVGLEIESILENVNIRDYKDLINDDRVIGNRPTATAHADTYIISEDSCDADIQDNCEATNDPSGCVDSTSDTSDGSGSTTGSESVTSIDSSK